MKVLGELPEWGGNRLPRDSPGKLGPGSLLPLSLPMFEPLNKLLISFVAQTLCHTDHRYVSVPTVFQATLHVPQPALIYICREKRELPYCVSLTCTILYLVWYSLTLTLV